LLDALVTIGAFTRLRAMAAKLARAFVPDAYDNLAAVSKLDERWLIVHGTATRSSPAGGRGAPQGSGRGGPDGGIVRPSPTTSPDGKLVVTVFESIGSFLTTGKLTASGRPANVKLIPFGQGAPINP
jgi:hypothetical protein